MAEHILVGAHFSTSQGLPTMLQTALELQATCAQIFTTSPQMWHGKRYTPEVADAFKAAQAASGIAPVVAHDSYLINLASSDEVILAKSRSAFQEEIARCGMLGLPMIVMHLGAYLGGSLEQGLRTLASSLNMLIPLADDVGVQLVLETTAGQGTTIGGNFSEFPRLFEMIPAYDRLGICLDTCHVFVAGYDLRDREHYEQLWQDFDRQIGLRRLKVLHLNDTERELGSHGDRHAGIGQGQLGLETFRMLMLDPRFRSVLKILETPGGVEQHAVNLRLLHELAAGE